VQSVRTAAAVRSCVTDDYVTTIGHHPFHEVACYVTSGSVSSVVVAATPSGDPAHVWTQLERAVAAYPLSGAIPNRSRLARRARGAHTPPTTHRQSHKISTALANGAMSLRSRSTSKSCRTSAGNCGTRGLSVG
jgi:hypothetical protein